MTTTPSPATICRCNLCSGEIEFESDRAGETVTCPHCASDTELYVPGAVAKVEAPPLLAPSHIDTDSGEKVFYQGVGLLVTPTRFVIGSELIPMRNITSVRAVETPAKRFWPLLGVLIFGMITAGGLIDLRRDADGSAIFLLVVFMSLTAVCLLRAVAARTTYSVVINTAGNDHRAFTDRDRERVSRIITALHAALCAK